MGSQRSQSIPFPPPSVTIQRLQFRNNMLRARVILGRPVARIFARSMSSTPPDGSTVDPTGWDYYKAMNGSKTKQKDWKGLGEEQSVYETLSDLTQVSEGRKARELYILFGTLKQGFQSATLEKKPNAKDQRSELIAMWKEISSDEKRMFTRLAKYENSLRPKEETSTTKPKRAVTPYFIFMREVRKDRDMGKNYREWQMEQTAVWNKMSDADKDKYKE